VVQIFIVRKLESDLAEALLVVRCHEGSLRVGDRLSCAIDPVGARHSVNAQCVEISLAKTVMVDELEGNFGGLVVLTGPNVSILSEGWTLCSE